MKATGSNGYWAHRRRGCKKQCVPEIDETDLISAAAAASDKQLQAKLTTPQDDRLFYLAEAFRRGMTIEEVHALTQITPTSWI